MRSRCPAIIAIQKIFDPLPWEGRVSPQELTVSLPAMLLLPIIFLGCKSFYSVVPPLLEFGDSIFDTFYAFFYFFKGCGKG